MRVPTILAAACLMLVSCQQEEGCTDAAATNYATNAVEDDGSCIYPVSFGGYTYDVVAIGDQVWFAENLRTTVYANGDSIAVYVSDSIWSTTTMGAVTIYGEGDSDCHHFAPNGDACDSDWSLSEYGRLYNWYAVDDARGLCPSGWHVPTDGEWTELEDYISSQGFSGTEHAALKSIYGWVNTGSSGNGTDDFGFSAPPGGARHYSDFFYNAGSYGFWWSSSPNGGNAWARNLNSNYPVIHQHFYNLQFGFSVRCIKD